MSGKTRTVTAESALAAAIAITETQGLANLSIQSLAAELGIKPASLYNHIKGIDEVKVCVARYAVEELNNGMRDAAVGYAREEALFRIAAAFRDFALRRPELYNALNLCAAVSPEAYRELLRDNRLNAAHQILNTYHLDDGEKAHFLRAFRSGLHGFISLEAIGAFGDGVDTDESFTKMTAHLIKMLEGTNE